MPPTRFEDEPWQPEEYEPALSVRRSSFSGERLRQRHTTVPVGAIDLDVALSHGANFAPNCCGRGRKIFGSPRDSATKLDASPQEVRSSSSRSHRQPDSEVVCRPRAPEPPTSGSAKHSSTHFPLAEPPRASHSLASARWGGLGFGRRSRPRLRRVSAARALAPGGRSDRRFWRAPRTRHCQPWR
jgi:hypothetical protein